METGQSLVTFSLEGQRYALDLARVQRSIRVVAITPLPKAPPIVAGVIDLAGEIIPVINIRERFNHPVRTSHLSDHLLIATTGKRTVALLVDETTGVLAGTPENYTSADTILPRIEHVTGAVKLEDGLVLIHDLDSLLSLEEETAINGALDAHAGNEADSRRKGAAEERGHP